MVRQDWFVVFRFGKLRYGQAGMAGHGKSGHGTVWSGSERQARFGWQGKVRFGSAWQARCGVARWGLARCGLAMQGRYGRLKQERRKSEVGRYKQKAILIRHRQVQSVR